MNLLYSNISKKVWNAVRSVFPEFSQNPGLSEREKCRTFANALVKQGLSVAQEVPVIHRINGKPIGIGYMDLLVDGRVVIEIKNTSAISVRDIEQLDLYLRDSGMAVGLLINFGVPNPNLDNSAYIKKIFMRRYLATNDPTKVLKG